MTKFYYKLECQSLLERGKKKDEDCVCADCVFCLSCFFCTGADHIHGMMLKNREKADND